MIDNRSGVQLAAAQRSAQNYDFNLLGGAFGGGAGGYTNTPEGKILIASFMDSYNQIVKATRSYRAQEVKGGLGTGGALGVQGGQTPASRPAGAPARAMSLAEAQRRLSELGFDPGPADGAMGQRTANAFRAFQRARGLDVTGRLDAATAEQLAKIAVQHIRGVPGVSLSHNILTTLENWGFSGLFFDSYGGKVSPRAQLEPMEWRKTHAGRSRRYLGRSFSRDASHQSTTRHGIKTAIWRHSEPFRVCRQSSY
jgi:hypothetical protein